MEHTTENDGNVHRLPGILLDRPPDYWLLASEQTLCAADSLREALRELEAANRLMADLVAQLGELKSLTNFWN